MMEFAVLLLILGALALVVGPRLMARRGPRGQMVHGQLLVTGISGGGPGPDAPGVRSRVASRLRDGCQPASRWKRS